MKLTMTPVPEEKEAYKVVEKNVPKIVEKDVPKIAEKETYKVVEVSKEMNVACTNKKTEEQDAPTTSIIARFWNVVRRIFCI